VACIINKRAMLQIYALLNKKWHALLITMILLIICITNLFLLVQKTNLFLQMSNYLLWQVYHFFFCHMYTGLLSFLYNTILPLKKNTNLFSLELYILSKATNLCHSFLRHFR
jgi:hypothetical protein